MKECPKCDNKEILYVEYSPFSPEHYDGVSEYQCAKAVCRYRQGRWTGKEIKPGFVEPKYGRGGKPVPVYLKDRK